MYILYVASILYVDTACTYCMLHPYCMYILYVASINLLSVVCELR